ncbi:hypothetical protein [Comamonas thiooxydans]|uniref:hypothetical protein n=1 Tax=Comamonas thiooxydans TaxID=363952 RepID=UPI000B41143E|nr:hypothetical protein [Comamonas thiooxydans]
MFALIITIVAIALVVALVAATMYHGGDTLTQGRATADASAFVAGAQQVSGAAVMYQSLEGSPAADAGALVTSGYLASVPAVKGVALVLNAAGKLVTATVASDDVCKAINKAAGATDVAAVADIDDLPYGCVNATKAFSFKF